MATNNSINNLNFYNVTSVNSATILPATAYGTEVICTGASAYALTLPTVTNNANKFIDIFSQTTSGAIVTITPASGTIAGQATLAIGSGDGVKVMNDGTNWWVLNSWLQPVNFSVSISATQSIPNNASTTVVYNQADFNIGSYFDTTTGIFTPLLPGKYLINQNNQFQATATASWQPISIIQKTGVTQVLDFELIKTASVVMTLTPSTIVNLNGSTDTIFGQVRQNSGGSLLLDATATNNTNRMWGHRISLF